MFEHRRKPKRFNEYRAGPGRETDDGVTVLQADLPAVVSVNEKINEPRYPSFKGIMAAKNKPLEQLTLADIGIDAGSVGWAGAGQEITEIAPVPARAAGEKFEDDGTAHEKIVAFLESLKVI